jgi:Methyltransferase domain
MRRRRQRTLDRQQLLSLLPSGGVCVEVGTWRGDFAAAILRASNPTRLCLVDSWEHRSEEKYEQTCYGGAAATGQAGMDAIYESVINRFQAEIDSGKVLIRRARSEDAAASFDVESLDWVYIDADHSYEGVKRDLNAYFPLVKPGGILAGDDYGQKGTWYGLGVAEAVDEFAERGYALTVIGTQYLLKKP